MSVYTAENTASRERLHKLTARLTDADLAKSLGHLWTVKDALVHLMFWDQHRLAMVTQWLAGGEAPIASTATEAINEAVRVLGLSIPPREILRRVVESAEALDAALEKLTPDQVAAIQQAGMNQILNRSLHRNGHLDEIEQFVK